MLGFLARNEIVSTYPIYFNHAETKMKGISVLFQIELFNVK